ncbi:30S ribosomal protein S3 [Candidatus Microgenomates bacterium]|nr:30S ribosomal protein S3 [Candidatus Microgenomates bacterium]
MGQKVNPVAFRTGTFSDWKAKWFADKRLFSQYLLADLRLREILTEKLKNAGLTNVIIERLPKAMTIRILVTRPGMVIGRGGTGVEELREFIRKDLPDIPMKLDLAIEEVREPELSARLVANRIATELERRLPHRRVATRAMERVMSAGAAGIKILFAGRIEGSEIARKAKFHTGSVPTQTLRADIDYAQATALLKRGYVGIKVWIHKKGKGVGGKP